MLEVGEDTPLLLEAAGELESFDDSGTTLIAARCSKPPFDAFGEVDHRHAAPADLVQESKRSRSLAFEASGSPCFAAERHPCARSNLASTARQTPLESSGCGNELVSARGASERPADSSASAYSRSRSSSVRSSGGHAAT